MLDILFVTDFVCPFCLVAKEALKQAMEETGIQAEIRIQPMELTEEPKERVDTFHDEVRKSHYEVLKAPAEALGLNMRFPPEVVPRPYTRLAWEGWFFAKEKGLGHEYSDRMYRAYFIDERDIGDMEVLKEIAASVGLSADEFEKALIDGTYYKAEREASDYSRNTLEVKGIPTLFIDGQRVKMSQYTKEEAVLLLTGAKEAAEADDFCGCGPDGCGGAPEEENAGGCGPDGCQF